MPMNAVVIRNSQDVDQLSELKSQFLTTLSYEIRTPLTGILGMLDLMLETELTPEQQEFAESSRLCAEQLLGTMNSALQYAALAADQVALEEAELPLRELLETMLDGYSKDARAKGLSFVRSLDPDLPETVITDGVRFKQMVGNLIDNAVKFTSRGEVEVAVHAILLEDGDFLLTVAVRDTGIGIPANKVDSIFDSFRQLEGGLDKRFGGMGLGLAVTHKLSQLMRAQVEVTSVEGEGSTFTLDVPMQLSREWKARMREMPTDHTQHYAAHPGMASTGFLKPVSAA
jgi:signal transduction histidine kinase